MSERAPIHRILAFDFGTKDIGLAVANTLTKTPQSLPSLKAKNGIPNWETVKQLIQEWKIDTLIVGLPLHMDGTENDSCKRARKFSNRLKDATKIDVELVDERLSSEEAEMLDDSLGDIHGRSAMLILQTWLNKQ